MATTCYNDENQFYAHIGGPSIYLGPRIIIIESIHLSHIGEQVTASWIIISLSDNLTIGGSGANPEFSIKSIINLMMIIYRESTII